MGEHTVIVVRFSRCELKYGLNPASRSVKDEIKAFTRRATSGNNTARRSDAFSVALVHSLRRSFNLPVPNLRHVHSRRWTRARSARHGQLGSESQRGDEREWRNVHHARWAVFAGADLECGL